MKSVSLMLDFGATIASGYLVGSVAYGSGWAIGMSILAGGLTMFFISSYLFALLPGVARAAGGSETTAALMLRGIRGSGDGSSGEPDDLESGTKRKKGKVKMGFQPGKPSEGEAPKAPLVPAPACSQCSGTGDLEETICPVCRGTGRKPDLWKV